MELRQLEYFIAVCEHEGFSRAAESLYVTQPTLTMSLKRLETELGVELYDHRRRDLVLTEAGQLLLARARRILHEVQQMIVDVDRVNPLRRQELVIGIPNISCAMVYPLVLQDYAALHPGVDIQILDLHSSDVIALVEKEDLELGFCVQPPKMSANLEFFGYATGRARLLLAETHRLAAYDVIPLAELENEQLMFCRRTSQRTTVIERVMSRIFESAGIEMPPAKYFHDQHTMMLMAASGYGLYCFTDTTAAPFGNTAGLVMRDLEGDTTVQIGLVYNKKKYLSEVARNFISFFLDCPTRQTPEVQTPPTA